MLSYLTYMRIALTTVTCSIWALIGSLDIIWTFIIPMLTSTIYHIIMIEPVYEFIHRNFVTLLVAVLMCWSRLEFCWWVISLLISLRWSVRTAIVIGCIMGSIMSIILMVVDYMSYLEITSEKQKSMKRLLISFGLIIPRQQ